MTTGKRWSAYVQSRASTNQALMLARCSKWWRNTSYSEHPLDSENGKCDISVRLLYIHSCSAGCYRNRFIWVMKTNMNHWVPIVATSASKKAGIPEVNTSLASIQTLRRLIYFRYSS